MTGIFKFKEKQPIVWFNKNLAKSNKYCLYCHSFIGEESELESNKEHLIGKEFVPKGSLDGDAFNFIFRACKKCNVSKSKFEGHVSSVSLYNSSARLECSEVDFLAIRKAEKDYHPSKSGVVVRDCGEQHNLNFGKNFSFGMHSPPQLESSYSAELALRHIQGLFSLLTSENPQQASTTRLLHPSEFKFFDCFNELDWGNQHLIEIIDRVKNWPCHANISTANGFFKAIMRRSMLEKDGWFWGMEWNKSIRVIGGISQSDKPQGIFSNLPSLNWKTIPSQNGEITHFREEIPLDESDLMFEGEVVCN